MATKKSAKKAAPRATKTTVQAITPFFMFHKGGAEAVKLYVSTFKNAKIESMVVSDGKDGGKKGQLMHALFTLDGTEYAAMDGGPHFTFSEGLSLMVTVKTQKELDTVYAKLVHGGKESRCGWLTDKFGVSWQVVPTRLMELMSDPDPERAGRAVQAMLTMDKLNIKGLERAADGR